MRTTPLVLSLGICATVLGAPALALAADPAPPDASPEPPPPAAPKKLASGDEGFLQLNGLIQGWTVYQAQDGKPYGTSEENDHQFFFRIRRTELKLSGAIIPEIVTYAVMFDPARVLDVPNGADGKPATTPVPVKDAGGATIGTAAVPATPGKFSILQDAYMTFVTSYVDVSVGQFKVPLSWEGYNSAGKIIMPERAPSSLAYGDKRDLGVRLEKTLGDDKGFHVHYWLGLYSGQGQNTQDSNDQKDLALRLEVFPMSWLMVGGVGYYSIAQRDHVGTKDRVEADLRLTPGNALLQAEYIRGRDRVADNSYESGTHRISGQGFYVAAAYTFAKKYQPVLRVGYVDDATQKDHVAFWSYEVGFNYLLRKDAMKLQLDVGQYRYDNDTQKKKTFGILALQVAF